MILFKTPLAPVYAPLLKCLTFLVPALMLLSCDWLGNSPSFGDDYVTYDIKAGSHDVENNISSIFTASSMRFQAVFDSSCIYKTVIPENQYDINKLMGFSDCSSQHQVNSARFGWNWQNNALHIYAYIYVDGLRSAKELGVIEIGQPSSFKLSTSGNSYVFNLNGTETIMPRHCSGGVGVSYKLLPYFGGDEPAPQNIRIKIRNLE
ncbi:hypothetical protein DYBT9275_05592 [Dyadobacter sp. CECT 9275]|uniref:Lipoprotein n=1 Tax=Dyadobacter helix TaxID=2822344 RepID=A0A916JI53_9BACT|nr:hypothetical protein [Dyadobacter sp. CECT 9275]CAG5016621.1 hypothetical protein DYBT9275_05592 [Dyadobacter sp. CECT 9275]